MESTVCKNCGGCVFRELNELEYRQKKEADFNKTISLIKGVKPEVDPPVFIKDGERRRADMAFLFEKKELKLGFYKENTHELIDITKCLMLDEKLNAILPNLKVFLQEFCMMTWQAKNRKKIETKSVNKGNIKLLHADNGIDLTLELDIEPEVSHRMLIADFMNKNQDVCRISWKIKDLEPETIVSKISPELYIKDCVIEIPSGTFLQASKAAETIMIEKMLEYLENTRGKIIDLFCGLGTFTYPLAKIKENEIISVDSFEPALKGLERAIAKNQLHNVKVITRNLFKYPFDKDDMKSAKALVIDPPRAGAHEQCREILKMANAGAEMPQKIVFISCNPKTFIPDAEILISAGYSFKRVMMIDQFVYSKHQELMALFIFNPKK